MKICDWQNTGEVEEAQDLIQIINNVSGYNMIIGLTNYIDPDEFGPDLDPIVCRLNEVFAIWKERRRRIRDAQF